MTSSQYDRLPLLVTDHGMVGASLDRLSDQFREGWRQAKKVKVPSEFRNCTAVVICGMGGSHLGADILLSSLEPTLKKPVVVVSEYDLPAWVNNRTLVICSSYSGSTIETLTALQAARQRGAKVIVITSGGRLAHQATKHRLPLYQFSPTENPSGQPRLGIGYSLMSLLACLRRVGAVNVRESEIDHLEAVAWSATKRYGRDADLERNVAKQVASAFSGRVPLLVGSSWSAGNLHTFTNQIHENAKTFAAWALIPELNHHLMEGLRNRGVAKSLHALFVADVTGQKEIELRFRLTEKIFHQLGIGTSRYKPKGSTRLEQAIDLLAFGGYVSWYLAALRRVKPAPIPTVDFLKKSLSR